MIEFTSGDLLRSDAQYIAQGVAEGNQEGLGTGLALKISQRWPDVQSAFKNLVKWADRENIESIGLPKIGAGLGKMSWESDVKPLMEDYFTDSPCRFIIYEEFRLEDEK